MPQLPLTVDNASHPPTSSPKMCASTPSNLPSTLRFHLDYALHYQITGLASLDISLTVRTPSTHPLFITTTISQQLSWQPSPNHMFWRSPLQLPCQLHTISHSIAQALHPLALQILQHFTNPPSLGMGLLYTFPLAHLSNKQHRSNSSVAALPYLRGNHPKAATPTM